MRKIKVIFVRILVVIISFCMVSCNGTSSDTIIDSVMEPDDPGTIIYDDKDVYSVKELNLSDYSWNDADGVSDGRFADGMENICFSEFSVETVSASTNGGECAIDFVTGKELTIDKNVPVSLKNGEVGSSDDCQSYNVDSDSKYAVLDIRGSRDTEVCIVPDCEVKYFEQADYISFYIAFYHSYGGQNKSVYLTFSALGVKVINLYRNTWYEIKIPLSAYQYPIGGVKYGNKNELYDAFSSINMFSLVSSEPTGNNNNDFKVLMSKPVLSIEKPYDAGGRNFTDLAATKSYLGNELHTNTFIYYGNTAVERRLDYAGLARKVIKYSYARADGGNIAVNPLKKIEQLEKYDYLCVVMYVKTDNHCPIQIGFNGLYNVKTATVSKILSNDTPSNSILVSANKWVLFKIPTDYIITAYSRMKSNHIYTAFGVSYVYYNNAFPLFYINGDFANNSPESGFKKNETYGFDLYVSHMVLEKTQNN